MALDHNGPARTPDSLIDEIRSSAPPNGCSAIWFFGQASVALKGRETVIHVDPFYSDYLERQQGVKRWYPSLLKPEDITAADLVLITHEHEDHLDPWTLSAIAAQCPQAVFMAPAVCRPILESECGIPAERIVDALTGEWIELQSAGGEGVRIKPVPAAHEALRTTGSEREHRYVGYLIELNGVKLYHAGDTTVYPGLADLLREEQIDVGLLPINGRDYFRGERGLIGNMNYREAAELASAAQIETVIPLHYDGFAGNSEKPGYFVQELYERTPWQKCHVMARAERYVYVSPRAFV
ncbi:L-ascorbate metabolism protein UlaG, beta-lactamase superfamily [Paenibacillus sp. UNCCL117]|uniref:MBL fold metallo-hydrolase n=1 Tax=unclassified Paenibacillus TaxID=185978 RepID=UPI0008827C85|nr:MULTISPECIES: MBL fold metallo-hydrolase [unclassified Paenibacillus]SDD07965.1 L-ascorbate metabolism protein UlaG, beta-lactamase superfamily [Paenibacillus sp. cl123]SFW31326.1 L-ascorbate metabolism protein UlaG, beta-lactamase superfamily [Paenibacillus sp. UNCCL117]